VTDIIEHPPAKASATAALCSTPIHAASWGRAIDTQATSRPGQLCTRDSHRRARHRRADPGRDHPRRPWHAVHLVDLLRRARKGWPAAVAGQRRGIRTTMLSPRRSGPCLQTELLDRHRWRTPRRVGQPYLRVHRRLSRPLPSPLRTGLGSALYSSKPSPVRQTRSPHRRVREPGATSMCPVSGVKISPQT
jgi:hypothetical protein